MRLIYLPQRIDIRSLLSFFSGKASAAETNNCVAVVNGMPSYKVMKRREDREMLNYISEICLDLGE